MPSSPHNRTNIRKSEMRSDKAFSRFAVMRSFEGAMEEVLIMTVVFGGSAMIFSMICRAALWSLWRDIEERTEDVRREV